MSQDCLVKCACFVGGVAIDGYAVSAGDDLVDLAL